MTDPLLAVILATSSSRGSHIVFRWPNKATVFKRYSRVKYYADNYRHDPPHRRAKYEEELDPVRQKANWDRHDEDEDENAEQSDEFGQSDTPSSSEIDDDSDASISDEDRPRSVRNHNAHDYTSVARSKTSAGPSRSKSKARRPINPLDDSLQSLRQIERSGQASNSTEPAANAGGTAAASGNGGGAGATGGADSETGGTSNNRSPEEKARREERAARAYRTYLGYDTDFLASLLSPRPELAHQKFELVVDDLAFLGHPVCVGPGGQWGDLRDQATQDNDATGKDDNDHDEDDDPHARRGRTGPDSRRESQQDDGNDLQGSRSLSAPKTQISDTSSTRSLAPLTQFHLVLVLDRPDPSAALAGMDLSSWLQLFYDHIVFKMTASLFAEQVRVDYVSKEAESLLALRERCMDDGQSYSAYAAQCLGISSLARCIRDLHKSISISSDAFLTINDRIEVHLQLPPILQNASKMLKVPDIETELDPNDPIFLSGGGFAGMGKEGGDGDGYSGGYDRLMSLNPGELTFEEWTRTTGPYLLPWKTLLLLQDHPDDLNGRGRSPTASAYTGSEADLPGHATEGLGFEQLTRKFTSLFRARVNEMLNFDEVANVLGWDLYDDVYPMVRHLIYYRQARVIDVPKPGHVYGISPLFDLKRLPTLSRSWAAAFPDLPSLPGFLSQLSSALRPLNAQLPGRYQRQLCLDVLVWLLRREIVVKLHVRMRLVATERVKVRAIERRAERAEKSKRRKERRLRRQARSEAKQIRKQQREERRREAPIRKVREESSNRHELEPEQRGRSRERDRSRSADARQASRLQDAGEADDPDATMRSVSGLGVSRPDVLADPDLVATAAATAEAIVQPVDPEMQEGGQRSQQSTQHPHPHQHHPSHHHHHRHQHQHRHGGHHRHIGSGAQAVEPQPSAPILIGSASHQAGSTFEQLKFERRPVLRSRSPSTALSVSFSNNTKLGHPLRNRAGTTASSSSGGTGGPKIDAIAMTPSNSYLGDRSPRRSATPRGRRIPRHGRDLSNASRLSQASGSRGSRPGSSGGAAASAAGGGGGEADETLKAAGIVSSLTPSHSSSVPSTAAALSRKARMLSRSPSRARMKVTGFGQGEEVEIDEDSEEPSVSGDGDGELADVEDEATATGDEAHRLSLVGEEAADDGDEAAVRPKTSASPGRRRTEVAASTTTPGATRMSQDPSLAASSTSASASLSAKETKQGVLRRISMASERPDFPPSPLASSLEEDGPDRRARTSSSATGSGSNSRNTHSSASCSSSCSSSSGSDAELDSEDHLDDDDDESAGSNGAAVRYDTAESLIVEPSRATREENEWIAAIVEGRPGWLVKKLFRLLPYLNGKHTVDEIEYRVGMKRKEVRFLLAEFREVIVTFMHP